VEDDLDIRELERYTLENNGYAVLQAEHGKQALEVLSSESVDLIILDMMMPVMDGLSLIKTLRFVMNDTTPSSLYTATR
jgi:DNA-binding response OmpR family regulator